MHVEGGAQSLWQPRLPKSGWKLSVPMRLHLKRSEIPDFPDMMSHGDIAKPTSSWGSSTSALTGRATAKGGHTTKALRSYFWVCAQSTFDTLKRKRGQAQETSLEMCASPLPNLGSSDIETISFPRFLHAPPLTCF